MARNFGSNEDLNRYLANRTGYSGDFGSGGFNAFAQQQGIDVNSLVNSFQPQSATPAAQPPQIQVREGSEFIQNYMNPYTQDVINAFETDWDRAQKMAQNQTGLGATASGAFGGSRSGVASALTAERGLDQYGREVAGLRKGGFDTAVQAGLRDAAGYNQAGLLAPQLQLQGAQQAANMANMDTQNLFNIGSAQQQLGQSSLDLGYQDFLKQWQYPMDMVGWAASLANGVPQGTTTVGEVPADTGGKMQSAGSLISGGAAMAGKCWVARAVYGEQNPKWLLFRHWLENKAPRWFDRLYAKHGKRAAKVVERSTILRRVIRIMMDKVARHATA